MAKRRAYLLPGTKSLQDAELKERLQALRQTDNFTNLYYLFRTWFYFAFVIGGTIAFYYWRSSAGLSFWWNIPVTIVAVILIGNRAASGQSDTSPMRGRITFSFAIAGSTISSPIYAACFRCTAARIIIGCNTWLITNSSTTRSAIPTSRNCKPAATGCRFQWERAPFFGSC